MQFKNVTPTISNLKFHFRNLNKTREIINRTFSDHTHCRDCRDFTPTSVPINVMIASSFWWTPQSPRFTLWQLTQIWWWNVVCGTSFLYTIVLYRFRLGSCKLPAERGRNHNIPRDRRFVDLCNQDKLGDQFHILLERIHKGSQKNLTTKLMHWLLMLLN